MAICSVRLIPCYQNLFCTNDLYLVTSILTTCWWLPNALQWTVNSFLWPRRLYLTMPIYYSSINPDVPSPRPAPDLGLPVSASPRHRTRRTNEGATPMLGGENNRRRRQIQQCIILRQHRMLWNALPLSGCPTPTRGMSDSLKTKTKFTQGDMYDAPLDWHYLDHWWKKL